MKPRCGRCRHRGFWRVAAPDGRPRFVCDSCRDHWTHGGDGGPYAGHEMKGPPPQWTWALDWSRR